MFTLPQDVWRVFWFEMHVILLGRFQDLGCKTDYILASVLSVCLSPWLHSCLWPVVKVTGPAVGGDSSPHCGKDDGHPLACRRSIYPVHY